MFSLCNRLVAQPAKFAQPALRLASANFGTRISHTDLVELLAKKTDMSKKDVATVINALGSTIREEVMEKGSSVKLNKVGTIKTKYLAATKGVAFAKHSYDLPERTTMKLSVSTGIKK
mmetsp:Transcript_27374/g.55998  ORF Transcript_27374/g.55998 Transcript_27374/m.55998 type:complete len:118 (+) Transcript_27374:38-391(+)|eukprot:CAMPEP_0181299202 /NCGR_PEP_ID=MMETSP1101-20121128/6212_1 /TAXON_ID=46948 /ORGANISM="Rhodomonas abbreviata, Strain Caron Lab Isolate" /LENGTH=117 /DNA_ID=CAMNT_0023404319 /DNA_START=29 /DNA_END=382 /DNA_ORIENTATION=+